MNNANLKRFGINACVTVAVPAIVYAVILLVCRAAGADTFGVGSDWRNILLNTTYTGMIALAMSYNLTSGRFDFSIGSVLILSAICGGTWAMRYNLGPWGMFAASVAVGAALGLVSGLAYVLLRLPPMIISLGIAMVYEALGFLMNGGGGVKMMGRFDLLIFAKEPNNLIFMGLVLLGLIYLLNFTGFGYNTVSLTNGQKNAVDVGINENRNAVACYVLAGVLMAMAGLIYISQYGTLTPSTGLGSASYFMGAFLPMFIGGSMARFSDRNIGIVIGAFIQACITSMFAKLGFSSSVQTVLNGVIVLLFLVYSTNRYRIFEFRAQNEKRRRALASQAR
jgi:ribose transport system permease protein